MLAAGAAPGPSTVVVRGRVNKLFLEPHDTLTRTVEGDFSITLDVKTASGLHAERTFFVKGKKSDLASTESVFQAAADDATKNVAFDMATAFAALLDRYPELGAAGAARGVAMNAEGAR